MLTSKKCWLVLLVVLLPLFAGTAAAQTVSSGNNVEFGGSIVVPEGTVYRGDAVAIFGSITVDGEVEGDAVAVGGSVTVNGKVNGDAVAVGGGVKMGENGYVSGDATSVGGGVTKQPGQIRGSVNSIGVGSVFNNINFSGWRWNWSWNFRNPLYHLFLMAGWFAVALVTLSLFPGSVKNVAGAIEEQPGRSTLVGLLVLFLALPLTFVLVITIVGIPLIPILWLALLLAKVLGYTALVNLLGRRVIKSPGLAENQLGQLAIGVGILGLVGYVPGLGGLVGALAALITIGAVLDTKFGTNRPWLPPRQSAD